MDISRFIPLADRKEIVSVLKYSSSVCKYTESTLHHETMAVSGIGKEVNNSLSYVQSRDHRIVQVGQAAPPAYTAPPDAPPGYSAGRPGEGRLRGRD